MAYDSFAAVFVFTAVFRDRCNLFQQLDGFVAALPADLIMGPFPLFPACDDAGIAEDLHVIGEGGLRHSERVGQYAGAFLAAAQQLQYLQAPWIAERLEDARLRVVPVLHASSSNQLFLIYYRPQIENCQCV